MYPEISHCWGPLSIQSYGVMILMGVITFSWLFLHDPRRIHVISTKQYFDLLSLAILAALVGGRVLSVVTQSEPVVSWSQMIAPWEAGFSVLGSIIAVLIVVSLYVRFYHLPIFSLLDIAAIYAPLLQAIARIGCFLAGCCAGIGSHHFWSINGLHPTQLYSSVLLLIIFTFMYLFIRPHVRICGVPIALYVILVSAERFVVDFWRGDREFLSSFSILSITQLVALFLFVVSSMLLSTLIYHCRK